VAASLLDGTLLNHFLKNTLDRPRPDLVAELVEVETTRCLFHQYPASNRRGAACCPYFQRAMHGRRTYEMDI
jgi:hypothetical protein